MSDKKFPLVSIVTVTRNLIDAGRKDFFRQCVESVRMQDYPTVWPGCLKQAARLSLKQSAKLQEGA